MKKKGAVIGMADVDGLAPEGEGFRQELTELRRAMALTSGEVGALSRGIGGAFRGAVDDMAKGGAKLSDVLKGIGQSVADTVFRLATKPVTDGIGGVLAEGLGSVLSGGFTQTRVTPFAKGGVLSGPVQFPMRGGLGLAGEAGPEAIMPLTRGADGRLGVAASGGRRAVNVVFHVHTPDVEGFRRSQSQIAAQMSRVMSRGERNL